MQGDSSCDVVIIGAGPYGLASAAHLRAKGVETRVFGEPMSFWERHMPRGMFLRSAPSASSLGDPTGRLGLSQFRSAHGLAAAKPVPIDHFVRYGHWFQEHAVPNVERRGITRVSPNSRGFHIRVADGEEFHARRVVVATGISNFAHRPTEFEKLPLALASHTFDQDDLGRFARKSFVNGTEFFYSQPELVLDVGVRGMVNVIDACRKNTIGTLVLASSSEVYQTPPQVPTAEDVALSIPDPLNPR